MTLLPPNKVDRQTLGMKIEEPQKEYFHNWLYSVVPIFPSPDIPWAGGVALLTGYCRICDQVFSKNIPWNISTTPLITKMNIPKVGCIESKLHA